MVAMFGRDHAAPFAMPPMRTAAVERDLDASASSRRVGRHDGARGRRRRRSRESAAAARHAARSFVHRQRTPMTPVEATTTSRARSRALAPRARGSRARPRGPASPVAAFAQPR
jgi:hypothetical protein